MEFRLSPLRRSGLSRSAGVAIAAAAMLAGCASYQSQPLPHRPDLATRLTALDSKIPAARAGDPPRKIDIARPLSIDDIGLLAILNDPALRSEPGEEALAQAGIVQATLLPNPSANLSYGALLGGPGTASSIAASLSQDIAAIVARGARTKSARAHLSQVEADQLWREWQVAQKARQLALDIALFGRSIRLSRREIKLLSDEIARVRTATAAGNLDLAALAPLLAARAGAERSLATLLVDRLKSWQALDGLLGLFPGVEFAIMSPRSLPLPPDLDALVASLPDRRPDLVALRLGYGAAEENARAAILGQFPAFTLGATYGSDTTAVESAGPSFTFALPIFDRNQGQIAKARATRLLLREQYQARLDRAVANIHALLGQSSRLSAELAQARQAAAAAQSLVVTARQAYGQGNLDQRTVTDYETTALERALQVVTLERQIGEDRLFLSVELGLGLPKTRIALSGGKGA